MKEWQKLRLDEAFWFQEGPGVRKWQFTDKGIKLLNVANITKLGVLDLNKTARYLSNEEITQKYNHFLVDEGDLVIASSGISFDEDGLLRTRGAFVQKEHLPLCMNTSTIRFKAKKDLSEIRFFKHWLDSKEFRVQVTRLVTGSAQQNFGPSHLSQITITLPPLPEQRRIAAILDKADSLRERRRQAIAKLDELLQSVFIDMFGDPVTNPKGWPKVTIRDLVSEVNYGTSSKAGEHGQFPILRMNNITYKGGWNFSDLKYIDLAEKEHSKYLVQRGDLLFNRTNSKELVGKTAVYRRDEPMAIAGYLIRVRGNKECNTEYLSGFLNSSYGKLTLLNMCKSIIGMANINAQELQSIPILKPPKKLQDEFASIVSKIEANKETLKASLEKTNIFFTTLQQRAFTGELFPEEPATSTQPLLEVSQHV